MQRKYRNNLQKKQDELNSFVLKSKGLVVSEDDSPNVMSKSEYLKNMILACHDEIREVEADVLNAEEFIDVLHFVLSIANLMDVDLYGVENLSSRPNDLIVSRLLTDLRLISRYSGTFKFWSSKERTAGDLEIINYRLHEMYSLIEMACKNLGVDMVDQYDEKYLINIERQRNNY